jgi:O-antigen ligase
MGLLKIFSILLILAFPLAEVGRVQFSNGIAFSLNDVLLAALIIVWGIYFFRKKKSLGKSQLLKPIAVFSAIGLISLALNLVNLSLDRFLISFLYLARWVCYASVYFIYKEFDTKFKVKINYAMLFSGFIVVLLGFVQYFFYPSLRNLYYLGWDEHLYRLFSSFLDPNFAGVFFALFFIYTVNFLNDFFKKKQWGKFFLICLLSILTLISLYLTYSRSALLMLLVSIVVYLYFINKKKFIVLILLLILSSVFILPKSFKTEGTNFLRATSSEARISTVREAVTVIQKNPLYGVGFNAYRYAENRLGLIGGAKWEVSHGGAGTDNSFLFVLATTGIIGLAAYLWLIYKIFALGLTNIRKNKLAVVLLSSLAGLIFSSLFINSLFYVLILEWIWIMAAFTESN